MKSRLMGMVNILLSNRCTCFSNMSVHLLLVPHTVEYILHDSGASQYITLAPQQHIEQEHTEHHHDSYDDHIASSQECPAEAYPATTSNQRHEVLP